VASISIIIYIVLEVTKRELLVASASGDLRDGRWRRRSHLALLRCVHRRELGAERAEDLTRRTTVESDKTRT